MRARLVIFANLLVAMLWAAHVAVAQANDARRLNTALIVADDLGFSELGCFEGAIETPHVDRLASDGLRLTQFYAAGRCCPSRASILTGFYSHRVGLGHMTKDIGANMKFGGSEHRTLLITARTGIYSGKTNVRGN